VAREEESRAALAAEVGTGTLVALAQTRVRVASLEAQESRARSELARHVSSLKSLLDLGELPELGGELADMAGRVSGATRAIGGLDLAEQPELLRLKESQRAAESAASARSRTLIPTVSALGSIEVQYPRALRLEWGPVYQLGLTLSWPFFDGLARENAVEAQEALAAQLGELSEAKKREIERKLIELEARGRTAEGDLASAKKTLEQTELYLKVARVALEAGTGTQLDVHNAELGIDQARTAVQRALFDMALIRAEALMVYGVTQEKQG
jgi:outer membrane protein TolC